MRNAMDAQEVAIGWWPGDERYDRAAFYAYAHPAPNGFADGVLEPTAARWEPTLGEFVLDWADVRAADDPHAAAVRFARSAFAHGCVVCEWDPSLGASAEGQPPRCADPAGPGVPGSARSEASRTSPCVLVSRRTMVSCCGLSAATLQTSAGLSDPNAIATFLAVGYARAPANCSRMSGRSGSGHRRGPPWRYG